MKGIMTKTDLTAAEQRAKANQEIDKLAKRLRKLTKQSLIFEPGETVYLPHPDGPISMTVIALAEKPGEYTVRLEDGHTFDQHARYFHESAESASH